MHTSIISTFFFKTAAAAAKSLQSYHSIWVGFFLTAFNKVL